MRRIKDGLDARLEAKGRAAATARARAGLLEAAGGRRAVEGLRAEVEAARERLCARCRALLAIGSQIKPSAPVAMAPRRRAGAGGPHYRCVLFCVRIMLIVFKCTAA